MPRYVAFLRAINVGGHTVKMDRLRALFEGMRLADVSTFIASGNVIFSTSSANTAALEQRIETALERALGYEVATFVRLMSELPAIAAGQPFASRPAPGGDAGHGAADGHVLSVGFLKTAPDAGGRKRIEAFRSAVNDFRVDGREVYSHCRTRTSDSGFTGALLERAIGAPATFRNITTVRKLAAQARP